jgi:hypothetical protein
MALCPALAAAQVELGNHASFSTRFGPVEVRPATTFGETIAIQGVPAPQVLGPRAAELVGQDVGILGAWARSEEAFDWALIEVRPGGNMCAGAVYVLQISPDFVTISEALRDCSTGILDLRVLPGTIEIDLFDPMLEVDLETVRFDGRTLTRTDIRAPLVPAATGGGESVSRWLGTSAPQIFSDPAERSRFRTVMSDEDIQTLYQQMIVPNPVTRRGDWIVGTGCMRHACNTNRGVWGLRLSDGAVAAAILDVGRGDRLFGRADDPTFQAAVAEARP